MSGLQDTHWKHPAIKALCRGLLREKRIQSSLAASVLLIGTWMTLRLLPHWIAAVAFLFTIVATIWIIQIAPWRSVKSCRLLRKMKKKPESIVWVYGLINQMSPYGFRFLKQGILYFQFEDGEEISVALPARELKLVSRFLNRVLPHATFGFSEEKANLFKKDPNALRRKI